MENNPIEINAFTFFLNFKSLGFTELYRIAQPEGFDVANFVVKQEEGRFGRDILFSNETQDLSFNVDGKFEFTVQQQIVHPDGTISQYLDLGFAWILETWKRFGFEGEIEFILKKDGLQFTVGMFDFSNCTTDGNTYLKCSIIQNTVIADYKRQLESSIDLFSTKNFKDETITPVPTLKFLRRAVPIANQSQWKKSDNISGSIVFFKRVYINFSRNIIIQDIQNTLDGQVDTVYNIGSGNPWREMTFAQYSAGGYDYTNSTDGKAMKLIKAKKTLTQTSVNVKMKCQVKAPFLSSGETTKLFYFVMIADEGSFNTQFNAGNYTIISEVTLTNRTQIAIDINDTVLLPLDIPQDKYLYGAWTGSNLETVRVSAVIDTLVTITASEISADTVISGARYIDVIKQCSKFINDLPVDASLFDVGGLHYNNVCYNRAMLTLETSNSLALINTTTPEGELGQVVYNTNDTITGILPLGLYFWNNFAWISINSSTIENIFLTTNALPAGTVTGKLVYNTNENVAPNGLCYWNGNAWISLQYKRPFITTAKDCFENAMTNEICGDYEVQEEKLYFGKYQDFYTNTEVASFLINSTKDYLLPFNERFKINNFKLAYDTFETNRLSLNTANDIHTEAEWSIPNYKVENKFERTMKYVRSGYSAQSMVDLNTITPATADDNDDKVFIEKIIALPSGTQGKLSAVLKMTAETITGVTRVTILNKDQEGDSNNVVINWTQYGFEIGDAFQITQGQNAGNYIIEGFSNTLLSLRAVGFVPTFDGDAYIYMQWTYNNVFWQTEHDQNFFFIDGLDNKSTYPNLDYSLGNNLFNWKQYIASMCLFSKADSVIRNLFFKNNPALRTQRTSLSIIVTEKGSIQIIDLPNPLLGSHIPEIEVYASFSEMLLLLITLKNQRGFIRCYDLIGTVVKGYAKELDYTWKTGSLKMKLEEKFEAEITILTYADGILTVDDVVYNLNGNVNWWRITGNYFQCFDEKDKAISNVRFYNKVSLNGIIYVSAEELHSALIDL